MPEYHSDSRMINRRLSGDEVVLGVYTLTPLARLRGRVGNRKTRAQAMLRLEPVEVLVRGPRGEQRIAIGDQTAVILGVLVVVALLIAAAALGVARAARRSRKGLNDE